MKFLFYIFIIIDLSFLLGKWELTFAEANFNLVNSAAFKATPKEQQDEILEVNELYLNNAYYEFKEDTVFWTDVNQREKKVVLKKGKWMVLGDTLQIFDYDKIVSYRYLMHMNADKTEISLKFIYPNNSLSRSTDTYKKVN